MYFFVQTKAGNATGFILLGAARFLTHVCESPNSCHQLPPVACGNLTLFRSEPHSFLSFFLKC